MNKERNILIGIVLATCAVTFGIVNLQSNKQLGLGSTPPVYRLLPDPTLTPGVTNPDITQANISQNICNPKWSTSSIRPTSSYTSALKIKQIAQYGYTDTVPANYEEDHLISLELGGSPTDPKNLWPQSYKSTPNAKNKDAVENYLHKQVCNGAMTLVEAQKAISANWIAVYGDMMSKAPLGSVSGQGLQTNDQDDD